MVPGATSPGTPLCAVTTTPSPMTEWPTTPTCPARMTFDPTVLDPARPTWAHSRVILADDRPVTDLDQVVDLRAGTDAGLADRSAVDAGVGLDFNVVVEDSGAGLQDLVPGAAFVTGSMLTGEAKAVGSDDGAVLQQDIVAERQCSRTTAWAWAKKRLPTVTLG